MNKKTIDKLYHIINQNGIVFFLLYFYIIYLKIHRILVIISGYFKNTCIQVKGFQKLDFWIVKELLI